MAARKIRILEMIDDASLGGGQVHVLMLAKYLDRARFEVEICCHGEGYLVEEGEKAGVKIHHLSVNNELSFKNLFAVLRVLRSSRWDILHTHGGTSGFWGRIGALIGLNPRHRIHTYHGLHYLNESYRAPKRFRRADELLLRFTDAVVCVCASDYRKGIMAGVVNDTKGTVINNGIEIEKYHIQDDCQKVRQEFGVSESDFLFGNIGRLHRQKGQMFLIEAFARIHKDHPGTRLWIIGEGELRSSLEALGEKFNLGSSVSFLGTRADIPNLLHAMDAFVLSSLWEGQPISVLEAMAAGKPIVASNVDGVGEILSDDRNALLTPPANVDLLADAMRRVLSQEELRREISAGALKTVTGRFTVQTMVQQIGQLYERTVR